jgi:hypothetical protein
MEQAEETSKPASRVVTMVFLPLVNLEPNMISEIKGRHLLVIRTGEEGKKGKEPGREKAFPDESYEKMIEGIPELLKAAEDALAVIREVLETRLEFEAYASLSRVGEKLAESLQKIGS